MPAIANAASLCGGVTITTTALTTAGALPVVTVGDIVLPHPSGTGSGTHTGATIVQGSISVTSSGKAVAYVGCLASCGHAITTGDAQTEISG